MKKNLRRIILLTIGVLGFALGATAQYDPVIENGVLTSWPGATGSIKIPDGVTAIADQAFYEPPMEDPYGGWPTEAKSNEDITHIDFNEVESIGSEAFKGCIGIKTISAPKVKTIKKGAFEGCNSLKALSLPAITTIGEGAFSDCSEITSIFLGKGLSTVEGANPFKNSKALTTLEVEEGCSAFSSLQNVLIETATGTLKAGSQQAEIRLDNTVKAIGQQAFFNCDQLRLLSAPGCLSIGDQAFNMCRSLTDLLVPSLESSSSNWMTYNGVKLSVLDLHLSEKIETFHNQLTDHENLTIYVRNESIKEKLAREFKKATFVVGKPEVSTKYSVAYSCDDSRGQIEAWTTGAKDINSGDELPEGSRVSFKAIPRYGYTIGKWLVNGTEVTEGFDNEEKTIYVIASLSENINLEVQFDEIPAGDVIYFDTLAPTYGSISCKLEDGTEVKNTELVPHQSTLIFTATPAKGYRVAEWKERITEIDGSGNVVSTDNPSAGTQGKLEYRCQSKDGLHILVDFNRLADHFIVRYSSLNKFATLQATRADGTEVRDGEALPKGEKVIFTATPTGEKIVVDDWLKDGEVIPGFKEWVYTIESLQQDVRIDVVCKEQTEEPIPSGAVIEEGVLISWKPEGEATLPSIVTKIGDKAFESANSMTRLVLNETVSEVGSIPFLYCTSLQEISVPEGNPHFTAVDGVLYNKDKTRLIAYPAGKNETSYEILATAQSIQEGALTACPKLLGVTVAKGNSSLVAQDGALYTAGKHTLLYYPTGFRTDKKGEEITLAEEVVKIAPYALAYAPQIKKAKLPQGLQEIGAHSFTYCAALEEIAFTTESEAPKVEVIGEEAFFYCRALKVFPHMPSLKRLEKGAFSTCDALVEVHIPQEVAIASDAFARCRAIQSVYAYSKEPLSIDDGLFKDIVYINEATLYVPIGKKTAYANAVGWNAFSNIVDNIDLATNVPSIGKVNVAKTETAFLVEGLAEGSYYALYTLDGALVEEGTATSSTLFIERRGSEGLLLKVKNYEAIILY